MIPLQMLLACVLGWLEAEQRDVVAFLREENVSPRATCASPILRRPCEPTQRTRRGPNEMFGLPTLTTRLHMVAVERLTARQIAAQAFIDGLALDSS